MSSLQEKETPIRRIASGANYATWLLEKRNIDWGRQYTDLGEERQLELIKEYDQEKSDAALRASGGANYG